MSSRRPVPFRSRLPLHAAALASLLAIALCGCKSAPTPGEYSSQPQTDTGSSTSQSPNASSRARTNVPPGDFDYYILSFFWSPDFCETHVNDSECAARPGFVLHGLWPQDNDGSYPENCANPTIPTIGFAYLDLIPTAQLIEHEWKAHGTCSGLDPDAYFMDTRLALGKVEIPPAFSALNNPPAALTPRALLAQFDSVNPSFPRSSFALACSNSSLTAVYVCFDKNLNPQACKGISSCGARVIKIPSS